LHHPALGVKRRVGDDVWMLAFVDTEFSDLVKGPELLSLSEVADAASSVPVDFAFENWIARRVVEVFFMEPHLTWDAVARRCAARPGTLESEA
jgi:hypothetical protein